MRAALAVLAALTLAGGAQAKVISVAPNAALTATPFVVSLGGVMAQYAFTAAVTGNGPGAAVATTGTAKVGSFFGDITDFESGAAIDQDGQLYGFTAFPSATVIPNSPADDFIALSFTLADGTHYGYAEVAGPSLVRYGYESTPGASIAAGAVDVPEPASMALLLAGLTAATFALRRAR